MALAAVLLLAAALYFSGFTGLTLITMILALLCYAAWANYSKKSALDSVKTLLANSFRHELAVKTFTDDKPDVGELKVAVMSSKAHLGAVLSRMEDAAKSVSEQSDLGLELAKSSMKLIQRQQQETTASHTQPVQGSAHLRLPLSACVRQASPNAARRP